MNGGPLNSPDWLKIDDSLKLRALQALAATLIVLAAMEAWTLLRFQPMGLDFLPLWTAGRMAWSDPGQVYDFAAVTHAQTWLLPAHFTSLRPYAYPPSALLVFAPLGLMSFWMALGVWLAVSLGVFLYGGAELGLERPRLSLALMALSPAVVLAVLVGQTVLLVTGLGVLAVVWLRARPRWAGVLLGIAAAIKPQVLLLTPIALLAGGALETAVAAGLTLLAAVAVSAAAFGVQSWVAWLGALEPFQRVVEETPHLTWGVITPYAVAHELGLPPAGSMALRAVCAIFAVFLVWRAWARPASSERRIAALLGGCLLVTPYAMHYDGSVVVPVAVCAAASRVTAPGWTIRFLALAAATEITIPFIGALALIAFLALTFVDGGWASQTVGGRREPSPVPS